MCSEAMGMARAMEQTGIPYIISFTIQADGNLIDGTPIDEAIDRIDAATTNHPVCYMANCVHPRIVRQALLQPLNQTERVRRRFCGVQAILRRCPTPSWIMRKNCTPVPRKSSRKKCCACGNFAPENLWRLLRDGRAAHGAIARWLSESVEMP